MSSNPGNAEHQLGPYKNSKGAQGENKTAELVLGAPRAPGKATDWHTRGYLPHYDKAGSYQMITYRLADSLPKHVMEEMEKEPMTLPQDKRDSSRREQIENWLDAGHGSCVLRLPEAAQCVVDTWKHFDGSRYDLIAGVVMPNHVHVLIRVYEGVTLGKIVQSWKSYTGRRIAEIIEDGRAGARRSQGRRSRERHSQSQGSQKELPREKPVREVWMREYWDRCIRDENHFANAVEYIHNNPVKAKLVKRPADWPWCVPGAPSTSSAKTKDYL